MSEIKKEGNEEKMTTAVSKEVNKKPVVTESSENNSNPATIDERLSKMEDDSAKTMNMDMDTSTPDKKEEDKPEVKEEYKEEKTKTVTEPEIIKDVEAAVGVSPVLFNETEEKSHKTMVAFIAGIVIGGLVMYLSL